MSRHRPADSTSASIWAQQTWRDLAARPDKDRALVVLPVHGFADHGFGLPLNTEEVVGAAVLSAALTAGALHAHVLVLPPLNFGLAPYPHSHFGVDMETALETLDELLASVQASGFSRVLLFNTSPWNAELVGIAALDARTKYHLHTFVIGTAGIGLGFHPADAKRTHTQAVAARLLGRAPESSTAPADVRHTDFRPGYYGQPAPVLPDPTLDSDGLFAEAAGSLAALLREIVGLPGAAETTAPVSIPPTPVAAPRDLVAHTADQLAALPDKAGALVIIPTGAIEQHGHHLPLGTDVMLGRLWLDHALPRLDPQAPVYVAPPLNYGKSNEHLGFAGTITLSARTIRRQLLALATHLRRLGFRHIALLNTHGGNSATLVATLREIQTTLDLRAGMLSGYYRPPQSPQEAAFGFHAGEWETSLMLAGAPDLVRMDRAVCEYPARLDAPGALRPEGAPAIFAWKTADLSRSGVLGDATLATAEKGARWLDEGSAALARKIEGLLAPV